MQANPVALNRRQAVAWMHGTPGPGHDRCKSFRADRRARITTMASARGIAGSCAKIKKRSLTRVELEVLSLEVAKSAICPVAFFIV